MRRALLVLVVAVLLAVAASLLYTLGVFGAGPGTSKGICVTDLANRTVCLKHYAKRIVSLWPEATRIVIALRAGEKLVGVSVYDKRDPVMTLIYPKLRKLPAVGTTDAPNVEEIKRLRSDVVFADARRGAAALDELQQLLGVPVVGVRLIVGPYGRFTYKGFAIVGKLLGVRGAELEKYLEEKLEFIRSRTRDIPPDERLRVYVAFARTPFTTYALADPLESAGLVNVALSPGRVWYPTNLEQIARWDPDIIVVHVLASRLGNYTVETILSDPTWRILRAVREGRVYSIVLGYAGWYPAMTVINTLQLAKTAYPNLFKDVDVVAFGNEVYRKLYGVNDFFSKLVKELGMHVPR